MYCLDTARLVRRSVARYHTVYEIIFCCKTDCDQSCVTFSVMFVSVFARNVNILFKTSSLDVFGAKKCKMNNIQSLRFTCTLHQTLTLFDKETQMPIIPVYTLKCTSDCAFAHGRRNRGVWGGTLSPSPLRPRGYSEDDVQFSV